MVAQVSQTDTLSLDRARQAASGEAGHLGGAGDALQGHPTPGKAFGALPSSAALASAVDALDRHVQAEFGAAEDKLRAVEQAIGAIEQTVRDVDHAAGRAMITAATSAV